MFDLPGLRLPTVLGSATLARAHKDLAAGVQQDTGPGSARVMKMLGNYGIGVLDNWCAAALGTWMREGAGALGVKTPIAGSPGAKDTGMQLQKAGRWIDAAEIRAHPSLVVPGMVVVWQRGSPGSWEGHIGVVSTHAHGGSYKSIEGNAQGGAVHENTHSVATDSNLLGMGWL